MRFLKLVPLLGLPLLLLGATCVTRVDQKGPAGPWVVEVTNTGAEPVPDVAVSGSVLDAKGNYVWPVFQQPCPFNLLPGQTGYLVEPAIGETGLSGMTLPLQLTSHAIASSGPFLFTDGVNFRILDTYIEHKAVIVEMRNDSANTYYQMEVCAVLFDASGEAKEIASTRPFLTSMFKPGDKAVFPVAFNSSVDGTVQLYVDSYPFPNGTVVLNPTQLTLGASRVVQTDHGRELQVVGEIENTGAAALSLVAYQTYLKTSPAVRADGQAASTGGSISDQWGGHFNGTGFIPAGQKAPIAFSLPLDRSDSTQVEVAGVEGYPSPFALSRLDVIAVTYQQSGGDSIGFTATVSNPTSDGMQVPYDCVILRGNKDQLVGASCRASDWIGPNGTLTWTQKVTELAPMHSYEVVVYGYPSPKIVPIP